jgi:hypothetical protein
MGISMPSDGVTLRLIGGGAIASTLILTGNASDEASLLSTRSSTGTLITSGDICTCIPTAASIGSVDLNLSGTVTLSPGELDGACG